MYLRLVVSSVFLQLTRFILFLSTNARAAPLTGTRIINGSIAFENQFPWHVSVIGYNVFGDKQLCGGSLIAREWVATAAHCVLNRSSFDLGFGSNSLMEPLKAYEGVTEYYIHPDYDKRFKHHDVALIKLPAPITQNEFIRIIALPNSTDNVTYNFAFGKVAGFGRYIEGSNLVSRYLRWASLQVIPNEECERFYGNRVIISSTMCAISVHNSNKNTCGGDSGGSLVLTEDKRLILAGIISFAATEQCGGRYPSGFMRIRPHLKWMREKMNMHSI